MCDGRNLVTWNSVINGFVLNGRVNETLSLFREMCEEGVEPDGFTLVSLLTACAEIGALALGKRVHTYMVKVGLVENLHAANALLDVYAKSGSIFEGEKVFGEMKEKSVVSWTTLIVGLAMNGFGIEAINLFKELERKRLTPSEITFVGVLYACSHCGMVDEGFDYFKRMKEEFGIEPRIEHYGCMVDLLGRAGRLQQAYEYIINMPLKPNAVIWRTLLGACTVHKHSDLAEVARARLLQLEPNHSGDYVLLSNLYASERRWSDVSNVRKEMLDQGIQKSPGHSLVELGNHVYQFTMGDTSHPQSEDIYVKLIEITKLLRLEGYVPHIANVLADIEEEEKETALSYHSEKIAIAFMLISTPPGTPIRVVKNLRAQSSPAETVVADCVPIASGLTFRKFKLAVTPSAMILQTDKVLVAFSGGPSSRLVQIVSISANVRVAVGVRLMDCIILDDAEIQENASVMFAIGWKSSSGKWSRVLASSDILLYLPSLWEAVTVEEVVVVNSIFLPNKTLNISVHEEIIL
ncbi:tetratricopeptide repeat (TPR)-like superfamily protein [Artemisia annua]|uniref:Tetratricopeptide repeat (TPR)-like superfamily protein n=1 Tax=Artemisia annua TaxID=35608 RepID=A0A2U1LKA3_ARTAN|nr:tetratricopeptide repeat (TPR)-like superfamily protein [Artemisia annua]